MINFIEVKWFDEKRRETCQENHLKNDGRAINIIIIN